MAAILGLSAELIQTICSQVSDDLTPLPNTPEAKTFDPNSAVVSPANLNSPDQTVISGATAAVERAADLCKQAGAKRAIMLQVSAPFHCALMQPAQDALARDLATLTFHDPQFPVASQRRRPPPDPQHRGPRLPRPPGHRPRPLGRVHPTPHRPRRNPLHRSRPRQSPLAGLNRQILGKEATTPTFNVEDSASLEKTLAALAQ